MGKPPECAKCGNTRYYEGSEGLVAPDKFEGLCVICHSAKKTRMRFEKSVAEALKL